MVSSTPTELSRTPFGRGSQPAFYGSRVASQALCRTFFRRGMGLVSPVAGRQFLSVAGQAVLTTGRRERATDERSCCLAIRRAGLFDRIGSLASGRPAAMSEQNSVVPASESLPVAPADQGTVKLKLAFQYSSGGFTATVQVDGDYTIDEFKSVVATVGEVFSSALTAVGEAAATAISAAK